MSFCFTRVFTLSLTSLILLCLGGTTPRLFAATPTNTLIFTEAYAEKLICPTPPTVCVTSNSDRYKVTAKLLLAGTDITTLNSNTVVDLRLGGLHVSQRLGDDPLYVPGRKAAKFATKTLNGSGKIISTRTISLKWTDKLLTMTVQGKTSDTAAPGWAGILAGTFSGRATAKIADGLNGTVIFGTNAVGFPGLPVTGTVTTKNTLGKDGAQHLVTKSSIKSKGNGGPTIIPIQVVFGTDTPLTNIVVNNLGGVVTLNSGPLAGVTLVIPPGALVAQTAITLSHNNASVNPRSGVFPGQALSVHTDGQTGFEEPLVITVPYTNSNNLIPVPYYVDAGGYLQACQIISVDREAGTLTFETFHASLFTWLYAYFAGEGGHTTYKPAVDGFQIVNYGSVYNPGGECFGISAFEQWMFANKGGGLYPKYMQDIPVGGGRAVKGQNIVATRAHTAVSRLWTSYVPRVQTQNNLTGAERLAVIENILDNTARPTILYLSQNPGSSGTHAVLAYDHNAFGTIAINDPNYPGETRSASFSGGNLTYAPYQSVTVIGSGSFRTESFENIYQDAQSGFSGNGAAQVTVSSHTDGQHVSGRTINFSGQIESGQVLVNKLEVWLNGTTKFEQAIGIDGYFHLPINLVGGENRLSFYTKGTDAANNSRYIPNTQLTPFIINSDASNSVILVTLTWDTDDTDLDLYTIDPTGDYSAYYHRLTADGGELDFDDTSGFGPEHWTLEGSDTTRWGGEYNVRLHYYSDHNGSSGPALATRWNISVLVYEGTPRAQLFNFTGVLAYDDSSNTGDLDSGPDWADVCTITPVEASPTLTAPSVTKSASGRAKIIVPIPSQAERLQIKSASEKAQRK